MTDSAAARDILPATSTGDNDSHERWPGLPPAWIPAFEWVERTVGGRIIAHRRQARWRPAWFFDVELPDGSVRQLYLRSQREESLPWTKGLSIAREYKIMRVLQDEHALIPRVHGFCPAPEGILMDSVPGRDRFDERDDPGYRKAVLEHYVETLAHAHRIDPGRFVEAGLRRPATRHEIGLMGFDVSEKWYRSVKSAPDPVNEFIIRWIHRHVPVDRNRVCWLHFDAGQFLHDGGRVTALMDVEFSCLGDPLADLGAMRMRDTAQPIGDLTHAYRHYAQVTGEPLDRSVINFHAVRFAVLTAMLSAGARQDPSAEFDLAQWDAWSLMAQLLCLEIIAEEHGIDLGPAEGPPGPAPSRLRPWVLSPRRILDDLIAERDDGDFDAYRLRTGRDLLAALQRADEVAPELEDRDRADETALLGIRPRTWQEADTRLEELIATSEPDRDHELVRFLHRRLRRREMILDPGMRELRGFAVRPIRWDQLG